jgi:hypothetical protein
LPTGGGYGGGSCRRWCTLAPGSPTRRRYHVDLETLLVALYVLVEDWWKDNRSRARRGPGRPVSLSDAEVLTLAILSQWPRWRSERDFCRFADAPPSPLLPEPALPEPTEPPHPGGGTRAQSVTARPCFSRAQRRLGGLPRPGHHPDPGGGTGQGMPERTLCRAGVLGVGAPIHSAAEKGCILGNWASGVRGSRKLRRL